MKITLIQRLFWSSEKIQDYIVSNLPKAVSEGELQTLKAFNESLSSSLREKDSRIADLFSDLNSYKEKLAKLEAVSSSKDSDLQRKDDAISELKTSIAKLETTILEQQSAHSIVKNEIRDQLKTIGKIERTFFGQTANKGKGELGERQLKNILEKSDLSSDLWVENLMVGSEIVEFAMKHGTTEKWIPVDSKVLEASHYEEDGSAIIDQAYATKVREQAKKVAKYLSKKNTADYGLLVLQSDAIYMKLYEEFPNIFQEVIKEHKIYIMSPSSFVQFAWSIAQILDIYAKVHKDEQIYDDMMSALDSIKKFYDNIADVHKKFNVAMETHYPTIQNKYNGLTKRLEKMDKKTNKTSQLKSLSIEDKSQDEE